MVSLRIDNPQVKDADLQGIEELTELRQLELNDSQITGEGLQLLKGLKRLVALRLFCGKKITDKAVENIADLKQLRELDLRVLDDGQYEQLTDAGVEHLKGLTELQKLSLSGHIITDAALKYLKGMKKLEYLDLNVNKKITGSGLEYVNGLGKLRELDLVATGVTDAE